MAERGFEQPPRPIRELQQEIDDWQTRVDDLKGEVAEARLDLDHDKNNQELQARHETLVNELQEANAELLDVQGDLEAARAEQKRRQETQAAESGDAMRGDAAIQRVEAAAVKERKKRLQANEEVNRKKGINEAHRRIANL